MARKNKAEETEKQAEKSVVNQTRDEKADLEILGNRCELNNNLEILDQARDATLSREIALKQAEKYLDGREYDLDRIAAEINAQVGVAAQAAVEIGRRLIAVKTVEGHGKFCEWVENNFPLSHRTAHNWMRFAQVMQDRPELNVLAKGGVSKALVLLSLPEEYLQEVEEEKTIDGTPLDEVQRMSKRELEAEVKKLRANKEKEIEDRVSEEAKGLKAEVDALIEENKRLKKFAPPDEKTPEWFMEQGREILSAATKIDHIVTQLMGDERIRNDFPMKAKVNVAIDMAREILRELARDWCAEPEID